MQGWMSCTCLPRTRRTSCACPATPAGSRHASRGIRAWRSGGTDMGKAHDKSCMLTAHACEGRHGIESACRLSMQSIVDYGHCIHQMLPVNFECQHSQKQDSSLKDCMMLSTTLQLNADVITTCKSAKRYRCCSLTEHRTEHKIRRRLLRVHVCHVWVPSGFRNTSSVPDQDLTRAGS